MKIKLTVVILLLLSTACKAQHRISAFTYKLPEELVYDTIAGNFYYEHSIQSYIFVDAIVKSGGLIWDLENGIKKDNYLKGFFINNLPFCQLNKSRHNFHYDSTNLMSFTNFLFDFRFDKDGYNETTSIHPFCGGYYDKLSIKIEVVYLGKLQQRTPLFLDCEEYEKYKRSNRNRNYEELTLPTYLITNVFSSQKRE